MFPVSFLTLFFNSARVPGGHSYVVVFEIESIRAHLKSNAKVKETKLNESRLLNLYAIDAHWDQAKPFYLVTAQKRIVAVYLWQAISKSFKKVKLFNMPDVCQVLALWGPVLFVGLPSEFSRINIDEEEERLQGMSLPQTIFSFHVSPLDVVHLEKELLICYNSELTLLLETVFSLRSNYFFFLLLLRRIHLCGRGRKAVAGLRYQVDFVPPLRW